MTVPLKMWFAALAISLLMWVGIVAIVVAVS